MEFEFLLTVKSISSCNCQNGFTGKQCETDIDECADFPCGEGAKCEDLPGRFVCHCPTGITGETCETGKCHFSLLSVIG